jgi:hypothetical protein
MDSIWSLRYELMVQYISYLRWDFFLHGIPYCKILAPPLHHWITTPTGQPHHQGDKAQRHLLLATLKPTVTIEEQIDLLKHRLLRQRIYGNMWGEIISRVPQKKKSYHSLCYQAGIGMEARFVGPNASLLCSGCCLVG